MSKLGGVTEEGTVTSNLPLLFADGYPTCVEKITEAQLEKFIPFMINCSVGREPSCKDTMPTPKWWPDHIEFTFPLIKPPRSDTKWILILKKLVTCCYVYHDCKFMLQFCSDLAKFPISLLKFVNLCDGTTSLHNKETGKLLVTFRNENRAYDRKTDSPRKYLLPRGQRPIVVQPPLIDIYLCDSCDAEFETLKEVREHERVCQQEQPPICLRSLSPDDLLDIDQSRFLIYFNLHGCDVDSVGGLSSPVRPVPYKRRCQGSINFNRCSTIPFSSPLGQSLLKKVARAPYVVPQAHLDRVERYCLPAKGHTRDLWANSYRSGPKRRYRGWVHLYSCSKRQRRARALVIETGLSRRTRVLLKKCPEVKVFIKRLTEEEIIQYTNGQVTSSSNLARLTSNVGGVEIPVIDLCSSDDESANTNNYLINRLDDEVHSLRVGTDGVSSSLVNQFQGKSSNQDLPPSVENSILGLRLGKSSLGRNIPTPGLINTSTKSSWFGVPKIILASENGGMNWKFKWRSKKD